MPTSSASRTTVNTKGAGPEPGTKLSKTTFRTDIEQWAPDIEKIAYKGYSSDRVIAALLQAAVHEPKLFDATPQSLYLAIMKTARWGLDIGDTVHLVPLNKKISKRDEPDRYILVVEAWPDYKGLKALAIRQSIVRSMEEYVIYAGDDFDYQLGLDANLRHRPTSDPAKRGTIVGAYTIIHHRFGQKTFHYMPIADIEAIRAKSKSWGPNQVASCPAWYAKKTVVRDYLNRQPKQGALSEAIAADDTAEEFDRETGEVFGGPHLKPAVDPGSGAIISELDRRRLYSLLDERDISSLTEAGGHEALHRLLEQVRDLTVGADISTKSITVAEYGAIERLIGELPPMGSQH